MQQSVAAHPVLWPILVEVSEELDLTSELFSGSDSVPASEDHDHVVWVGDTNSRSERAKTRVIPTLPVNQETGHCLDVASGKVEV